MTKRYHSQHEICHLFVEQSPDCTSADLRSGNLNFSGPTLTSFGWWTLAHWTGRTVQAPRGKTGWSDGPLTASEQEIVTKRVLLRNYENSGHSGFNSDGKQQNILSGALRDREDYVEVGCNHDQIKRYVNTAEKALREENVAKDWARLGNHTAAKPYADEAQRLRDEAWRILGEEKLKQAREALMDRAKRLAKPTAQPYLETMNDTGVVGSDVSRRTRIADLMASATIKLGEIVTQFGFTMGAALTPTEIVELHDVVTLGYQQYNDPKRVKARIANDAKSALIKLRKLVSETFDGKYYRRSYYRPRLVEDHSKSDPFMGPNGQAKQIIAAAFDTYPIESLKLMQGFAAQIAEKEIVRAFNARHPMAARVREARLYGSHRTNTVTPDEWRDGKNGYLEFSSVPVSEHRTLVRAEGTGANREIVTSLGARVPFKDGVKLYLAAARSKVVAREIDAGKDWNGLPVREGSTDFKAGYYAVNSIDRDGNCKIGCHQLDFVEMERLACKEVPELVKARYPVPSTYLARDALDMVFAYPNGGDA